MTEYSEPDEEYEELTDLEIVLQHFKEEVEGCKWYEKSIIYLKDAECIKLFKQILIEEQKHKKELYSLMGKFM